MQFWQSVHGVESEQVIDIACFAEELGYSGITFGDHLVKPVTYGDSYPYSEDGKPPWDPDNLEEWTPPYPDAWILSAVLAQATHRIRFMPYVYVLPLRDPVLVAAPVTAAELLLERRI